MPCRSHSWQQGRASHPCQSFKLLQDFLVRKQLCSSFLLSKKGKTFSRELLVALLKTLSAVVNGNCPQAAPATCAGCGGGGRAACHGTAQPEGHTGHAAPAWGSCSVGHWLQNVQWSPGQDRYSLCCQKLEQAKLEVTFNTTGQ